MIPLHDYSWTVDSWIVDSWSVDSWTNLHSTSHKRDMLSTQTVTEINRLHFNCSRMTHGTTHDLSPREKIEKFLRANKFKDHAIQSIINALNLQRYSSLKLEKCFLMDKDGVRLYLTEQKWNGDAIEVFMKYVWFDKLV